jgi:hypothetical protein
MRDECNECGGKGYEVLSTDVMVRVLLIDVMSVTSLLLDP